LKNRQGSEVAASDVERFTAGFRGQVIRPGASDYDAARRIWNASIDRFPGLIVRPSSQDDVARAIGFARDRDVLLAIRGGGHNVGGRALCDEGVVIDLAALKRIEVDATTKRVRAGGGCTLGDVDRATHEHGLAVPLGVVSKTGIAGLTLGGGVGWLLRKHGMTIDNVVSFDVVTADGTARVASEHENPELFWALRGGSGNFGVVTTIEYRAHEVKDVVGGMLVFPRARARETLRGYRLAMQTAPDELSAYCAFLTHPEAGPITAIIGCYCGEPAAAERAWKPFKDLEPIVDGLGVVPFPQLQSMLDAGFAEGNFNYWKSTFINELSDDAIEILIEAANTVPSPASAVLIEHYGGAASRVDPSATAFWHRSGIYDAALISCWQSPADTQRNVDWTRRSFDTLRPFGSGAYLLNFLDQEEDSVVRAAFGGNHSRLVQMKNKYDPTNLFRLNQNIKPSA
jgi:hypothetical protein